MNFPPEHQNYLTQIGLAGKQLGYPTYVVGGYVRDLFLQRPCKDIDVVCVGSGIELAKQAAKMFENASTVSITLVPPCLKSTT